MSAVKGSKHGEEVFGGYGLLAKYAGNTDIWLGAAAAASSQGNIQQAKQILSTITSDKRPMDASIMLVSACLQLGGRDVEEAVTIAR